MTPEEQAEYERLRRQASVRHRRTRWGGASLLLLLSLLLAPAAVVTAWLQDTVTDTDRYVETVAPLASEPSVQKAVSSRLTNRVMSHVDVKAVTDSLAKVLKDAGAPPKVVDASGALTVPLQNAVKTVVDKNINRVVSSDAFEQVWVGANRRAQSAVVNMLTGGNKGALSAQNGNVELDVGQIVDQVKQRLVDQGFQKAAAIPDGDRKITLFHAEKLAKAQNALRLLDVVGTWVPVAAVVLAALAIWTAPEHRRMLLVTGTGLAVMMVLLLVGLALVRRIYLDSVPLSTLPPDAASTIYDTFVRFLRDTTRTLLVISVITALAAYLYGPGRFARRVRRLAERGTTAAGRRLHRAGLRTGSTGRWLADHRTWTTAGVIVAGVLALLLWNHPTAEVVAVVLGIALAVMIVLAILGAAAGPGHRGTDTLTPAG